MSDLPSNINARALAVLIFVEEKKVINRRKWWVISHLFSRQPMSFHEQTLREKCKNLVKKTFDILETSTFF